MKKHAQIMHMGNFSFVYANNNPDKFENAPPPPFLGLPSTRTQHSCPAKTELIENALFIPKWRFHVIAWTDETEIFKSDDVFLVT